MNIKDFIMPILMGLLAFMHPITNFMIAAILLLALNYLFGLTADFVNGAKWSLKKSFTAFIHAFILLGIIAFTFIIGHYMHNDNGALQCVSYFMYVAIYFFGLNILRNIRELLTKGSPMFMLVDFIYYVLSLQFSEKIPLLKDYLRHESK